MNLDIGAWAHYLRHCPADACGAALVMFRQLAAIAESRLLLQRPVVDSKPSEPRFLTLSETARLLKVSEDTARSWAASGKIPSVRIARRVRVPAHELEGWLHGRKGHKP